MDLGLRDKVALVAASTQGLGRAIAEELAGEGADLVLCARTQEALDETSTSIRQATDRRVVAIAADLENHDQTLAVAHAGLREFGRIDVLVTNAGGPAAGLFEELPVEAWSRAVRQNLESVLTLTRAVLPGMKERQWGRIVNVTSIAVKQPVDNLIISNSIRAAVTGFARTLANEVAPYGITVNNALPGYTRTSRVEQLAARTAVSADVTATEVVNRWERQIPMGRLGEPREFAALVAFLASDRASYITGVSVAVDGGWIRSLF